MQDRDKSDPWSRDEYLFINGLAHVYSHANDGEVYVHVRGAPWRGSARKHPLSKLLNSPYLNIRLPKRVRKQPLVENSNVRVTLKGKAKGKA